MIAERVRRSLVPHLLLHVRPWRDRAHDEHGACAVCGQRTSFVANSWVLPTDVKAEAALGGFLDAYVRRESLFCRRCLASLRARRLAEVLLVLYAERASCFAQLVGEIAFASRSVAEVNGAGALHRYLAALPRLSYSEFRPGAPLGAVVDGVRNEDVTRLTYADESFDLVVHSDTLEHVPDPDAALREIRRVLRPTGRTVFTVPIDPTGAATVRRAELRPGGAVFHFLPPQYHGRGSGPFGIGGRHGDLLAFTDFGLDLLDRLRSASLEPKLHFFHSRDPTADVALVVSADAT